jgi:hypothetical protein
MARWDLKVAKIPAYKRSGSQAVAKQQGQLEKPIIATELLIIISILESTSKHGGIPSLLIVY